MELQDTVIAGRGRLTCSCFADFASHGAEGRFGVLYTLGCAYTLGYAAKPIPALSTIDCGWSCSLSDSASTGMFD